MPKITHASMPMIRDHRITSSRSKYVPRKRLSLSMLTYSSAGFITGSRGRRQLADGRTQSAQDHVPADDLHGLEQRRTDLLPRHSNAQDPEHLAGRAAESFNKAAEAAVQRLGVEVACRSKKR